MKLPSYGFPRVLGATCNHLEIFSGKNIFFKVQGDL